MEKFCNWIFLVSLNESIGRLDLQTGWEIYKFMQGFV
jgi:hypothetical protein